LKNVKKYKVQFRENKRVLKFRNIEKRFFPGTTAKGQPLEMVAEPEKGRKQR